MRARHATLLLLLALPAVADPWFAFSRADENLMCAHEQYARKHFSKMLLCLKKVFEAQPNESTRENAFDLLDAAFAEQPGAEMKLDWKLPREISSLEIIQRRLEWIDGTVKYQMRVAGNGDYRRIDQVQLVQYPHHVVIDKKANIGRWSEFEKTRKDVEYRFNYHSDEIDRPLADGLYSLKLQLDGGKICDGWFLFSHLTPTSSPKVVSPTRDPIVRTGAPTFYWMDFESDRYRDFEDRLVLVRLSPKEEQLTRWFLKRPVRERKRGLAPLEAKVGRDGILLGARKLDKGRYWLSVAYDEMRRLGDLTLGGQAMTLVPIVVKKP